MAAVRERGMVLVLAAAIAAATLLALAVLGLAATSSTANRDAASDRALLQARESLLAYAAERALGSEVGPGYLPCPDLDDDGWAESTCGSLAGDIGQEQRLGRFPWKTLGLPDLRDGHGERLWYAVSTRHKGLLNCAASAGCVDMTPDSALGTLSVIDPSGHRIHDGRLADPLRAAETGAAAVVIAPGGPLRRLDGWLQVRACGPSECDAGGRCVSPPPGQAARCDARNYLDVAVVPTGATEDNARFIDRSAPSSRSGNADGFITARPATLTPAEMNDRVVPVGYQDLMPRVMARVAAEVAHCLRLYGARPANAGRLPWAAPACAASTRDSKGTAFGRVPDPPFDATRTDSGGTMEDQWTAGCALAAEGWWPRWRPFVFYAVRPASTPAPAATAPCPGGPCLMVEDEQGRVAGTPQSFAVIVAGAPLPLAGGRQDHDRREDPAQWLEGSHGVAAATCSGAAPSRLTRGARTARFNDVVLAVP